MAAKTTYRRVPTKTVHVSGTRFVYRKLGPSTGVPVIFLHHLTAVLDDWDPRIIDGIAARHPVVAFDNRGIGGSKGRTPSSVQAMARDATAVIRALGFDQVDLFGFSLGGFVAQVIARDEPRLVRKLILAGTGPAGGEGIDKVTGVAVRGLIRGALTFKDPKHHLFFTKTEHGQAAARKFVKRLKERADDRDNSVSPIAVRAQLRAIHAWGTEAPWDLTTIRQPVLVVNGDQDLMVPTSNSVDLARRLPNAQLTLYSDAGHGGIFQYHDRFVEEVLTFLEEPAPASGPNGRRGRRVRRSGVPPRLS